MSEKYVFVCMHAVTQITSAKPHMNNQHYELFSLEQHVNCKSNFHNIANNDHYPKISPVLDSRCHVRKICWSDVSRLANIFSVRLDSSLCLFVPKCRTYNRQHVNAEVEMAFGKRNHTEHSTISIHSVHRTKTYCIFRQLTA